MDITGKPMKGVMVEPAGFEADLFTSVAKASSLPKPPPKI
jgi:hypothetical protein